MRFFQRRFQKRIFKFCSPYRLFSKYPKIQLNLKSTFSKINLEKSKKGCAPQLLGKFRNPKNPKNSRNLRNPKNPKIFEKVRNSRNPKIPKISEKVRNLRKS